MNQGWCSGGLKPERVQRLYNCIHLIRKCHNLPMEAAEIAHVEEALQTDPEGDDSDIVRIKCLSAEPPRGWNLSRVVARRPRPSSRLRAHV